MNSFKKPEGYKNLNKSQYKITNNYSYLDNIKTFFSEWYDYLFNQKLKQH